MCESGHQEARTGHSKRQADQAASHRQYGAFGEQLPDELSPPGANGQAQRDLPLAAGRSRKQ
jgi:hypothetical protein